MVLNNTGVGQMIRTRQRPWLDMRKIWMLLMALFAGLIRVEGQEPGSKAMEARAILNKVERYNVASGSYLNMADSALRMLRHAHQLVFMTQDHRLQLEVMFKMASWHYNAKYDPDSAFHYMNWVVRMASEYQDSLFLMKGLFKKAVYLNNLRLVEQADSCLNEVAKLALARQDSTVLHIAWLFRGIVLLHGERNEDAMHICERVVPYFSKRDNCDHLFGAYRLCGLSWAYTDAQKALEYFYKAGERAHCIGADIPRVQVWIYIADLSYNMGLPVPDSIQNSLKDIYENGHNDPIILSEVLLYWARYKMENLRYREAVRDLKRVTTIPTDKIANQYASKAHMLMGICHGELGNTDSSSVNFALGRQITDSLGLPNEKEQYFKEAHYWNRHLRQLLDKYESRYKGFTESKAKYRTYMYGLFVAVAILLFCSIYLFRLKRKRDRDLQSLHNNFEARKDGSLSLTKAEGSDEVLVVARRLQKQYGELEDTTQVTVSDLMAWAKMSEGKLAKELKKETGLTPGRFLREMKLFKARKLLEQGAVHSVQEASYASGFTKVEYFSKLFKERFGKYPSEILRKQNG